MSRIVIYENDEPDSVAERFAKENSKNFRHYLYI